MQRICTRISQNSLKQNESSQQLRNFDERNFQNNLFSQAYHELTMFTMNSYHKNSSCAWLFEFFFAKITYHKCINYSTQLFEQNGLPLELGRINFKELAVP